MKKATGMLKNAIQKAGEEDPKVYWEATGASQGNETDLRTVTQESPGAGAQLSNNKHTALGSTARTGRMGGAPESGSGARHC